ncbi:TPA: hypothetical protein U2K06_002819 [Legionella pneumophila]|nr:hypothetical protein [Legionella pneumophila]
MKKWIFGLTSYFKNVIRLVKESSKFYIERIEFDHLNDSYKIALSLRGKAVYEAVVNPEDIIKDLLSTSPLTKKDRDKLLYVFKENIKRKIEKKHENKFSLIKHHFSNQLDEPLVVYKDRNNAVRIIPASEIYKNNELISGFSAEDARCIGYMFGFDSSDKFHKSKLSKNHTSQGKVISIQQKREPLKY